MSSFARARDRLHMAVLSRLADGTADYFHADGTVIAVGIEVLLERNVERLNTVDGLLDRVVTITVPKGVLSPFDRKGMFHIDGKIWHIDGIADDDGHFLTLYLVP